jgi:hypothetical protein
LHRHSETSPTSSGHLIKYIAIKYTVIPEQRRLHQGTSSNTPSFRGSAGFIGDEPGIRSCLAAIASRFRISPTPRVSPE